MKNTKVRTKLDEERQFVETQGAGQEYLDAVSQPDEAKAADVIIESQKKAEEATKVDELEKKEALEISLRFTKPEYIYKLAQIMNEMAQHIDLPTGFIYKINFNEEKLNIMIKDKTGHIFGRGIKPCGDSDLDFHAIGVLLTQAENTIDQIEERGAFNKAGIIV